MIEAQGAYPRLGLLMSGREAEFGSLDKRFASEISGDEINSPTHLSYHH